MKLKKIASLMLAGVMAISMLAGCSNGGNDNKGEETVDTGIVAEVNNALSAETKEILSFTADPTLDTQLKAVLTASGDDAAANTAQTKLVKMIDGSEAVTSNDIATKLNTNLKASKDGEVKKATGVAVFQATKNFTEQASINSLVKSVKTLVNDKLVANNVETGTTKVGDIATKYSYSASVSMVKTTNLEGETCYYAAVVITATGTGYTV